MSTFGDWGTHPPVPLIRCTPPTPALLPEGCITITLKPDSDRATRLLAMQLDHRVVLSELPCNSILHGQSQLRRKTLDLFNIWQLVATGVAVSEQTGNANRPSLAVLTNQKQSFDDSLDNVTSQAHCDAPRYKIHCCIMAGSPG